MTEWMRESLRYAATQVLNNTDYEAMDPIIEWQVRHALIGRYIMISVILCPDAFQSQSGVKCL